MKKLLSILLSLCFCLTVNACNQSDEPIVLTILLEDSASRLEANFEEALKYANPDKDISFNFEYLSSDYTERQTQLNHYRTEIMSGKGPDIFVLPTWDTEFAQSLSGDRIERKEPLFTDLNNAINNRVFLPLDEMIANGKHLKLEEHHDVVMNAGKNDEGQVILPLLYSYELILLDKNKMEDPNISFSNLNDFLSCGDENLIYTVLSGSPRWIHNIFAGYIDYENGQINMSEDKMYDTLSSVADAYLRGDREAIYYQDYLGHPLSNESLYELNAAEENAYPFVVPNVEGGITAQITVYTAINRNTNHPQEAFNFIELFYDKEMQRNDKIMLDNGNGYIKLYMDPLLLGAQSGIKTGKINYSDEIYFRSYADIQDIHARITCARFTTKIDTMLCDLWFNSHYDFRNTPIDSTDFPQKFSEVFSDWSMMAAE